MTSEFLAQLHRDHRPKANSESAITLGAACEYAGIALLKVAGALRDRAMTGGAVSTLHTASIKSAMETLRVALNQFLKEDGERQ